MCHAALTATVNGASSDALPLSDCVCWACFGRYTQFPLLAEWYRVLSTSKDRNGIEYISTIEGKKYPFFGTQWHPEKPPFEFGIPEVSNTLWHCVTYPAYDNLFSHSIACPLSRPLLSGLVVAQPTWVALCVGCQVPCCSPSPIPTSECVVPCLCQVPHTLEAIKAAQHMANVFVDTARYSAHKPESHEQELDMLIYNTAPTFSAKVRVVIPLALLQLCVHLPTL